MSLVEPYNQSRVGQGSYELSLSRQVLVSISPESLGEQLVRGILFPSKLDRDPDDISKEAALTIPAGQFAFLYTEESVNIPKNVLAFISIKAKIKLKGLVNISGFHVDPGFSGRIKFSVYNAGTKPISLTYGEPYFLMWFAILSDEDEKPYDSKHNHNGQTGICAADREQMSEPSQSPATLAKRIEYIEDKVNWILIGLTIIFIPILICIFNVVFEKWMNGPKNIDNQKPSAVQTTNH